MAFSNLMQRRVRLLKATVPLRSLAALAGGTLVLLSFSVVYSYGNLNTYVTSYLRARVDSDVDYSDWIFVAEASSVVGGMAAPVGGFVVAKIGLRPTLIIGSLLQNSGFILTYFALDWGLWAIVFTIAVSQSLGYGLAYAPTVGATLKWFPSFARGSFASVAVAGYGFGSALWVPLQTALANPDNVEAVTDGYNATNPNGDDDDEDRYFVDSEVLDRTPMVFLVLAGCFTVLQILGISLLREPTEEEEAAIAEMNEDEPDSEKDVVTRTEKDENYSLSQNEEEANCPPAQAVKTLDFWLLYISFTALSATSTFVSNYQKAYAQRTLRDDQFLAAVGTALNVANGVSRILGGLCYDAFGFKDCVFVLTGLVAILAFSLGDLSVMTVDSSGAKVFYAFVIVAMFSFLPGTYSCFPPEVAKVFGAEHCSTNYGIILSGTIVHSLALILITQTVFDIIGYNWTFIICGFCGTLGMLATFLYKGNKKLKQ